MVDNAISILAMTGGQAVIGVDIPQFCCNPGRSGAVVKLSQCF